MRPALPLLLLAAFTITPATIAPAARAATATLTQASPPAVYHPAHAIDVAGISPGMTPAAVSAILGNSFGPVQVIQENMGLQDQGIDVATQTYTTRITVTKGVDDVSVWFGTPTTGNAVVEVTHQTIYGNAADAPTIDAARAALTTKYGPAAFDGPAMGTGEVRLLAWSYKGDKPAPCTASACRANLADGLSVADMQSYRQAVKQGRELTIIGMLLAGINDPSRVASVVVTFSDTATKLRTLEEALAQMKAAARPGKPAKR